VPHYIEFHPDNNHVTPTAPYFNLAIVVRHCPDGEDYIDGNTTCAGYHMTIGGGPAPFDDSGELSGHARGEISAAKWFVQRQTNNNLDALKQTEVQIDRGLQKLARAILRAKVAPANMPSGSTFAALVATVQSPEDPQ